MSKAVQIGDVCKHGHLIAGDNAAVRQVRGREVIRCAQCLADVAKRYNSTEKGKAAAAKNEKKRRRSPGYKRNRSEYDRMYNARRAEGRIDALLEAGDMAKYDDKKTAVQRVLGIKQEAMPAHEAMSEWFESNRSPCFNNPEDYIEFDDPRYPEEQTGRPFPSTSQAEALCSECPIRNLCLEFGLKNKEDFGIYGGKRLVGGRVHQGGSGRAKKEEK